MKTSSKTRKTPTRCACGRFAPRTGACKVCGAVRTVAVELAPVAPLCREVVLPTLSPAPALRREVLPVVVLAPLPAPESITPWLLAPSAPKRTAGILARAWSSLVEPGHLGTRAGGLWTLGIVATVLAPCAWVLLG